MRFPIAICVTAALVAATIGQSAFGAPSAAEKMRQLQNAGDRGGSLCRMLAEAKAEKTGKAVDFGKCATKHTQAFQKIESKPGAECPTTGDASAIQVAVALDTSALACRFKLIADPGPPAGGAIAVVPNVQVTDTIDPVLTVSNGSSSAITAYCLFASATCGLNVDFFVPVPAQSSVSWLASAGVPGQGVPPAVTPFSGELVCVQVDAPTDPPVPSFRNDLSASLLPPGGCRQPAILIPHGDSNNGDLTLTLGGGGNEYGPCPASIGVTRIETCWTGVYFSFQCN
ncbi:MAG: hypothetical protein U0802_13725 [Candidatus Binatia bacterium]